MVVCNVFVERIEGNLAIISVPTDTKRRIAACKTSPATDKKYLILVRKLIPPTAREGLILEISLGKHEVEQASPDLERTLQRVKLFNDVMDFMGQVAA